MPRNVSTLIAGIVCTAAGIFPAFAMNLLSFVGIYGTILAPIGAIIIVDHFLAKAVGIPTDPAERTGNTFNVVVLLAWLMPVGIAIYLYRYQDVFASYLPLPTAIACGLLYILLSKAVGPKLKLS